VPPELAAAALLVREDGRVLLVQHHDTHAEFGGHWSLPMHVIREEEVAEESLERLLREVLHVEPGPYEFAETVYVTSEQGAGYIVNVFTCVEWAGEPRYADRAYADAAWAQPSAPGALSVQPDMRTFLYQAFEGDTEAAPSVEGVSAEAVANALTSARLELIHAYDSIPEQWRDRTLDGGWSPLDVLAHAASVEAYYLDEALRLLSPGHTWRAFNSDQWEADYRARAPELAEAIRARLDEVRAVTREWLELATPEQLATFGNHPERGVTSVADRIEKIARHEREHAGQLGRMREAAQLLDGATAPMPDRGQN
jgi:ADP-ribose pyrophosphatase YjhB (NUDIX family)